MSSQLRCSRKFPVLALAMGSLLTGTAFAQQAQPTGEEDAVEAPAAAARSVAKAAPTEKQIQEQALAKMTRESIAGKKMTTRADGSRMIDLEGEYLSVAVATPAVNGGYVLSCASGESAVEHAKHAHDIEVGKAPKTLIRPTAKQQPVLEEK
jgi:hypothetical protein